MPNALSNLQTYYTCIQASPEKIDHVWQSGHALVMQTIMRHNLLIQIKESEKH